MGSKCKSSRPEVFCKKGVLSNSQNSQENTGARNSLLKKSLWHRCFPVNLAKFLRTAFFTEHLPVAASVNGPFLPIHCNFFKLTKVVIFQ